MLCKSVIVCVLIALVYCYEEEEIKSDELRQERNFDLDSYRGTDNQEKWHAVDNRPSSNTDWIPADGPSQPVADDNQEQRITKRRRPGRKRKRRPQNNGDRQYYEDTSISSVDDISEGRLPSRSRPKRPQRLDQRDENNQWREEMLAEEPFRPLRNYNRRRLYPKYEEEDNKDDFNENKRLKNNNDETANEEPYYNEEILLNDNEKPKHINTDRIRDPYTALNEESNRRRPYSKRKFSKNDETVTPSSTSVDLKALLKQSGGISLSELLQQKNLSLADLLKGEQHAISALTSIPEQTSEPFDKYLQNDESDRKYSNYNRRLPPVRKYQVHPEEVDQITTASENLLPHKNTFESDVEITTERRIFVPSHPKYYTSVDYKPNMNDLNNLKPTITTTTTELPHQTSERISIISSTVTFSTSENPTIIKTKLKNRTRYTLPPTLAKLKNAKTTTKTIINNEQENYPKLSTLPAKAVKINLNELFGMPKLVNTLPLPSTTTEGPMKISVNIEEIIENSKVNVNNKNSITSADEKNSLIENATKEAEKLKELTAKDEIMEILSDSVSRENLTRLLELRNMTLAELVEQRERGSSQRHLADIFHNQTKEPEPTGEMVVDQIIKTNENSFLNPTNLFETFPAFDLRPDNNIQSTHYTRESRENQFSSKESNDILGKLVLPVWRQAYTNQNNQKNVLPDKFLENDDLIINDETQRIEDIENKLAEAVNGALNIDVINHKTYDDLQNEEENEFFRLPYGVRSAIIASAIIIGISLLVFLTIFIVFKWTQRQRKHLNYSNSFSSAKIKSPILETPYQRRIFSSIMNSTFGRAKKIPTISSSEPHSMQEYLWENDRKPFQ